MSGCDAKKAKTKSGLGPQSWAIHKPSRVRQGTVVGSKVGESLEKDRAGKGRNPKTSLGWKGAHSVAVPNEVADAERIGAIELEVHGEELSVAGREKDSLAAAVRELCKVVALQSVEMQNGQRASPPRFTEMINAARVFRLFAAFPSPSRKFFPILPGPPL